MPINAKINSSALADRLYNFVLNLLVEYIQVQLVQEWLLFAECRTV